MRCSAGKEGALARAVRGREVGMKTWGAVKKGWHRMAVRVGRAEGVGTRMDVMRSTTSGDRGTSGGKEYTFSLMRL
jgi:hypothetical protein